MKSFPGLCRSACRAHAVVLLLLLSWTADASAPSGQWWNAAYRYRQQITIAANDDVLVAGYSVKLSFDHSAEVTANRSEPDGDDVRIVRWTGTGWQELHRVLDAQSSWDDVSTALWFRTQANIAEGTVDTNYYLYYGNENPGALLDNPEEVFLLFDGFSQSPLSSLRWTMTGSPSVSGGILTLPVGASIRSRAAFGADTIWEAHIAIPTPLPNGAGSGTRFNLWLGTAGDASDPHLGFVGEPEGYVVRSYLLLPFEQPISVNNASSWQTYSFARDGSFNVRYTLGTSSVEMLTWLWDPTLHAYAGNAANGSRLQQYDWVRIRRYRRQEPVTTLGSREGSSTKFVIEHDNFGIHCAAETITVYARDSANTPNTNYSGQIRLDTGSGKGTWALVASGSFSDGMADDGVAIFNWPVGQSFATFLLTYRSGNPSVDIDAYEISNTAVRDDDSEGMLYFSQSGFNVTSSALSTPAALLPFASPQTAGLPFQMHITAYGQTAEDPECGIIESYQGEKTLWFWSTYDEPSTGTRNVDIGGPIGVTETDANSRRVIFEAGRAVVTAKYKDAGKISIGLKDVSSNPALAGGARGSAGDIVFTPATLTLANLQNNPALDHDGPIFAKAGEPFSGTITAWDAEGDATPNFGRESSLPDIQLQAQLIAPTAPAGPVPLRSPDLTGTFASYAGGSGTSTNLSWPEVGIIRITPRVNNYMTSGVDIVGEPTGNVGRFTPAELRLSMEVHPLFRAGCLSGSSTYLGQPFSYMTAPIVRVTAVNAAGATTVNYRGDFFKLTNAAFGNDWRKYNEESMGMELVGAPDKSVDPVIARQEDGSALLTFNSGPELRTARGAPAAPFDSRVTLKINVKDADNILASELDYMVTSAGASEILFATTTPHQFRYGRLAFRNALGSELIDLPTPLRTEYFVDAASGFAVNTSDQCTRSPPITLTGVDTCVRDVGAPGNSTAGCSAPSANPFRSTALSGDFDLVLAAPGQGNHGIVELQAPTAPDWLKFDWDSTSAGEETPSGTATFGVFQGNSRRIDQRERY